MQKLEPSFGGVLFFEFVPVGVRLITRTGNDDKRSVIYKPPPDPLAPDQLEAVVPGAAPPSPALGSPVALPITKGRKASGVRISLGTSKSRAAPRICSAGFGKPDRRP